jgi:hypothetical protein
MPSLIRLENLNQLREGDLFYNSGDGIMFPHIAEVDIGLSGADSSGAYVAYSSPGFSATCPIERALILRSGREDLEILAGKNIYDALTSAQRRVPPAFQGTSTGHA